MICPRCASNQGDDIKFCTSCGANLQAVREVLQPPDPAGKFNWNNTWVAEMFLSQDERRRRKEEIERERGITPEVRRYNEIKAGVIVSSVGIAFVSASAGAAAPVATVRSCSVTGSPAAAASTARPRSPADG